MKEVQVPSPFDIVSVIWRPAATRLENGMTFVMLDSSLHHMKDKS